MGGRAKAVVVRAYWAGFLLLSWAGRSVAGGGSSVAGWVREAELKQRLLTSYEKSSLPPAAATTVALRITLKHYSVMEEEETVLADAWLATEWKDLRLSWEPEFADNITQLTFPHDAIWKPDLSVYNSAGSGGFEDSGDVLAVVRYTGSVLFVSSVQLHYTCVVDLTFWPHDTHNCTLVLGSWVHNGFDIDLHVKDDHPRLDLMQRVSKEGANLTRGSWRLEEGQLVRYTEYYRCCPEPYVTVRMSLILTRDAPAFAYTVKIPAVALCILTFVLFLLPPCAGEKILVGGLCLILDILFIAYTADTVAHAPSHTPLIVQLVCQQLVLTVGSVVVAAVTTRLARDPHSTPIPPCFRLPLHIISACLCLHNYRSLLIPEPWKPSRSYSTSVKTDELEMGESNGRAQLYSGGGTTGSTSSSTPFTPASSSPKPSVSSPSQASYSGLDYLLLAAVIDRLGLIVYVFIFAVNMLTYSAVL